MKKILEIKDLSVRYVMAEKKVSALDRVTLSVEEGEIFGIVGESGSGKTTLAFSIMGILPENTLCQGEIIFKEESILNSGRKIEELRGKEISLILQEPASAFNPVLTIGYQFDEFLRVREKIRFKKKRRDIMNDFLKKAKIEESQRILSSYPHQLSGGLLQRVLIAMALSTQPSLIIADEPTSSLDVTIESQIINLFLEIKKEFNLTMIFITHNLELINILCDKVAVIYQGKIVDIGKKEEVFSSFSSAYTKELVEALRNLEKNVV